MENPYTPPKAIEPDSGNFQDGQLLPNAKETTQPIIPAVIGLVTYGSSSPYALVLCIEQCLRPVAGKVSISTRIALVLSIIGTIFWGMLCYLMGVAAIDYYFYSGSGIYGNIGLYVWIANLIFMGWAYWRFRLFRRGSGAKRKA